VLLGEAVAFDSTGIEFALVALFIVLTIEQYLSLRDQLPLWTGALAAAVAVALLPAAHQLIGAVVLATAVLLIQYGLRKTNAEGRAHG